MAEQTLESILVVYQNPQEGRLSAYDDWYTNIHIRDAMRLDGAIATRRFAVHPLQPTIGGSRSMPAHWAHTIYEWESASASVKGHHERAGTSQMEISRDCSFRALRDYFFRPCHLSHGWSAEEGFRKGNSVLTVLLRPKANEAEFIDWFAGEHAPEICAYDGIGTAALFSLHEEQSLSIPCEFPMVAIYGLTDVSAALATWADAGSALAARVSTMEAGCWEARTDRLHASEVAHPGAQAAAEERRARADHAGNYLTTAELEGALASI